MRSRSNTKSGDSKRTITVDPPKRNIPFSAPLVTLPGTLAAPAPAAGAKQEDPALVDINTASTEVLVTVPGIGEALAQRIVGFREKNGPFETVDDLLKVRGIGEISLAKFRHHLMAGKKKK